MELHEAVERIGIHLDQSFLEFPKRRSPATLFHYTSQAGLSGIIEGNVVRATNLLYLNDSSELRYGFSQVDEILNGLDSEENSSPVKLLLLQAHELLHVSTLLPDKDFYAFCFCEDPDLLSQWRAYSAPGGGYAIGFETDQLHLAVIKQRQEKPPNDFSLFPVEYGPGENVWLLHGDLRKLCAALDRCIDESPTDEEVLLFAAMDWLKIILVSRVSSVKHPGFEEEREWRILVALTSDNHTSVKFRQGRNALIPYIELNVSDGETSKLPIREIVLGPTLHPQLARKALDSLLKKNGFPNVWIRDSEIPYEPKT